jgi:hypothetical protein
MAVCILTDVRPVPSSPSPDRSTTLGCLSSCPSVFSMPAGADLTTSNLGILRETNPPPYCNSVSSSDHNEVGQSWSAAPYQHAWIAARMRRCAEHPQTQSHIALLALSLGLGPNLWISTTGYETEIIGRKTAFILRTANIISWY